MVKRLLQALALGAISTSAFAYTDCTSRVERIYLEPSHLWIVMANGKQLVLPQASQITLYQPFLMTAVAARIPVAYRFAQSNVQCDAPGVSDNVVGFWLISG